MKVIEITLCIFAVLGIIDAITGDHFKIGEEFKKGIMAMGSLVFCMVGFIVLSPVIAELLLPVFKPITEVFNIDASIIAGFFSSDGGGGVMAFELTDNKLWAGYNGLIVGSLFGCMICLIPMSLNMTDKEYHEDVLSGLLCGISTIPLGCISGGLIIGTPIIQLLVTTFPVIVISIITCIGLVINPELCRKIFKVIGVILNTVLYLGLGLGLFQRLTGVVLVKNITPIDEAFATVCYIAMLLSGIFPLLAIISKVFKKPFVALGKLLKIDDVSVMGLITTLANCIPMYAFAGKMNKKGRIMNYAFTASAAFLFGDHMAFVMAISNNESLEAKYLVGMIVGKLIGGVTSLIVAHFIYNRSLKKEIYITEKEVVEI